MTSFEVCPSRVRVTRRISYTELDDLLAKEESNGRILESLMAEGNNSTAATNPSPSQSLGEGRMSRNNLGQPPSYFRYRSYCLSIILCCHITLITTAHIYVYARADPYMKADLSRLSYWATVRHKFRNKKHALDQYLRHKTELSLSVRMDQKTFKQVVSGFTSWSNATSMSLVSEYMILMCETVGGMCKGIQAPVLFKIQSPNPALAGQCR